MENADYKALAYVGGRRCLDFVATCRKRYSQPVELLADAGSLLTWLREAGFETRQNADVTCSANDLQEAIRLREAIYHLVRASTEGQAFAQEDADVVNTFARLPNLAPQLTAECVGDLQNPCKLGWAADAFVPAALSTIARDAVTLLSSPLIARVKSCANPKCSMLFLDDSQGLRRKWCSMSRCGNLSKLATYRSRQ
ncbi:CGNR zinc finger domain-containing protein [Cupriavidus lacunae]|uniref:4-hydroxybenzoyl-CoA reductase n=1 Tax=Cupriavidus lacunae TaxID=2666307 RepID=A0A370P071_9BURK|nr:CGNR zinc finger domain-containing protein [Cupriavidus lacunae]RDK11269.1 4-hydroxybenzoyl-CoA reductase [Cupriavidus lacunae]